MDRETEKLLEQERIKIAIEIQRNKILTKELEDIYWKLEEIRYSMENGL